MKKIEVYQRSFSFLIKISVLFFLIVASFLAFSLIKRIKEPRAYINFFTNIDSAQVESKLFDAIRESFVPAEEIDGLTSRSRFEKNDFSYARITPQYPPLLDLISASPLEMQLYRSNGKYAVPFKEDSRQENISWDFALDQKNKLYHIQAADMFVSSGPGLVVEKPEGRFMASNSELYATMELPPGLKEFQIRAVAKSALEKRDESFDYSANMKVILDEREIGEASVKEGSFDSFVYKKYVPSGWHKLKIAFTNSVWDPDKGWDRNLLLKDVEVYELVGRVYIKMRKGLEDKFTKDNYSLSYCKALSDENSNNLLVFFKKRFNVASLKEILLKDFPFSSLVNDVEINNLARSAFFAPAPTSLKFKIKVPFDGIILLFNFGVMEEAWDKPGDGVEFIVKLGKEGDSPEGILFSKYINPKSQPLDRQWFQGEVDLRRFKGREIELIFETRGSPVSPITNTQDYAYDWAVWSN